MTDSGNPSKYGLSIPTEKAGNSRPSGIVVACVEQWFYEQLLGMAEILTRFGVWTGTEDDIQAAVDAASTNITYMVEANPLECLQFRVNPTTGELEYRFGDGDWTSAGTTSVVGPRGDDGLPGTGPYITYPDLDPDKSDSDRRCAAAINLTEWFFERWNDSLDAFEASADFLAAVDAVMALVPPLYALMDAVTDMLNEIAEATLNVFRAWDTTSEREAWVPLIYCVLTETGDLVNTDWATWVESLSYTYLTPQHSFVAMLKSIDPDAVVQRARMSGYGDTGPICAGITCISTWYHDFLATEGMPSNYYFNWGYYDSGNDRLVYTERDIGNGYFSSRVDMVITVPSTNFTKVEIVGTILQDNTYEPNRMQIQVDATWVWSSPTSNDDFSGTMSSDAFDATGTTLHILWQGVCYGSGNGSAIVSALRIHGTGTDPFI